MNVLEYIDLKIENLLFNKGKKLFILKIKVHKSVVYLFSFTYT